jgi:hypothetical protein
MSHVTLDHQEVDSRCFVDTEEAKSFKSGLAFLLFERRESLFETGLELLLVRESLLSREMNLRGITPKRDFFRRLVCRGRIA